MGRELDELMERTPDQHRGEIVKAIRQAGGVALLPDVPDGPILKVFDPKALAAAIRHELIRSEITGWQKISLHMDLDDAAALMRYLEKP